MTLRWSKANAEPRVAAVSSDAGLTAMEAAERIGRLRKGFARSISSQESIDSRNKTGVIQNDRGRASCSQASYTTALDLGDDDEEFKLNLDDLKHSFDEAAKNMESSVIIQKCASRRAFFEKQLAAITRRMQSLDTDSVDDILFSAPYWAANPEGSALDTQCFSSGDSEEMKRLENTVPTPYRAISILYHHRVDTKAQTKFNQNVLNYNDLPR